MTFLLNYSIRAAVILAVGLGSKEVVDRPLLVAGQSDPALQIRLGTKPGTIEGIAVDVQGERAINAVVVLVPDAARRHRSDSYRTARTDEAGRFQLNDIAPGNYKLFAWENAEPGAWRDANFIRTYEESGKAVHIAEQSVQHIDTTVIPSHIF